MMKRTSMWVTATSALVLSTTMVSAGPVARGLACIATGNTDFTNQMTITNKGAGVVAAGKTVHWVFKSGPSGNYTFTAPLAKGKSVNINLPAMVDNGLRCTLTWS